MANQTNKNKQNVVEGIKNGNADWSAYQTMQNNLETTENVKRNTSDTNLADDTNPNKSNQ